MPVLENQRHELFAQFIAKGETADAAYKKAGYKPNRGNAAELKAKQSILDRVEELKQAAADRVIFTLEEAMQFLADIIQTPVGDVDQNSPLCQEWTHDEISSGEPKGKKKRGEEAEGDEVREMNIARIKVKMPDKLRALELFGKMAANSWFAPDKVQMNVTEETPEQRDAREARANKLQKWLLGRR